jgi:hypothetical protein
MDNSACVSKAIVVTDSQVLLAAPETLERFRRAPSVGCTSVMGIAQRGAGFNPALTGSPGADGAAHRANVASFNEYVQDLAKSPCSPSIWPTP